MSLRDMSAPTDRETEATIRLRLKNGIAAFDLMTSVVGCDSDAARGELIRMDPKTVKRARKGIIGETFIASALLGLAEKAEELAEFGLTPDFDSLFVIAWAADEATAQSTESVAA